ncbi:MAG TPA: leucyl/phenylalanyl-tRNA--protein transferase [Tepidisphaeraceae bacterium]|nr:leucyl/phenylalanyl-tRNA--protein transferase [Tepidisphaeraceae bacterium]
MASGKTRIDLDPETLLSAYAQGIFPMADRDGKIRFYTADPRGIIPLDDRFHIPGTLRQLLKKDPPAFDVRINFDFVGTMRACMEARPEGTWISNELIAAYSRLHQLGFAHSVEVWQGDQLVGGLYGVSLGAAFFGESMFHRERDASKVALVHLVHRMRERGFELLDSQATTSHLRRFGAIDVPAADYLVQLRKAMKKRCEFA